MDDKVDYRPVNLGRYCRGTPRERFNLWFAHPGLRDGFDALDRNPDDGIGQVRLGRLDRTVGRPAEAPGSGGAQSWRGRVGIGSRGRRRVSSLGAASAGSGRGR
ncbi:MAG: hypothetical protein KJ621_06575 [Proteobacteria bacterium]|nr:hypothetical protein [Pseudomonadota bacterium]MBU1740832.1 hypothetical protein [Pseudomonadota bacterium]